MCALVASASADVLSPDEAAAVEWVRTMVRDSGGKRLFLVAALWDEESLTSVETPEAPHLLCLWRMNKETRILLWKEIQPQLQLQELGLGGVGNAAKCSMEDEELAILFPRDSLQSLQKVFLYAADKVTDEGLCALASAGCGAQLTSLTLKALMDGVTDRGLCALASAGCGPKLTSLVLDSK